MKMIYIITGAKGHLGNTLVRMLQRRDCEIRGLVLPGELAESQGNVTYYLGDVRRAESLRPLFAHTEGAQVTVIHTAGIVDISKEGSEAALRCKCEWHQNPGGAGPGGERASLCLCQLCSCHRRA